MPAYRIEKAGGFIQEEITLLLRNAVRDPRVLPMSVTNVQLTPDRRIARVYVACYTGEEDLKAGLEGLEHAKGFLRRALAPLLHWPFTPHLEFRVDSSWEYGKKIDSLLEDIGVTPEPDDEDDADTLEEIDDDAEDDQDDTGD